MEQEGSETKISEYKYVSNIVTLVWSQSDRIMTKSFPAQPGIRFVHRNEILYCTESDDEIDESDINDSDNDYQDKIPIIPIPHLTEVYIALYDGELVADWSNNTNGVLNFIGAGDSLQEYDDGYIFNKGVILNSYHVGDFTGIIPTIYYGRLWGIEESQTDGYDCDGDCQESILINQTRYHCTVCDNFDLCEPCYKKGIHNSAHAFEVFEPLV